MSDAAPSAPSAPAAAAPAAAKPTGAPAPSGASATGPQTPGAPVRGADGKFAPKVEVKPELTAPKAKLKIKDFELDEDAAYAEIMRGRSSSKHLTEAQKRIEKAEALEKAAEARKAKYRDDPDAFFEDLGIFDAEGRAQWASKYLYDKHIKPSEMTAEQRAIAERDAKIAAFEAKEKAAREAAEASEQEKINLQAAADIRKQVGELLKTGQIPQTPGAVKRVVERLAAYEAKGMDVDPALVAKQVRDEFTNDTGALLEKTPPDELAALWGPERMGAIVTNLLTSKGIDGFRAAVPPATFKAVVKMFNEWALAFRPKTPGAQAARPAAAAPKPEEFVSPADYLMGSKG